jgi:phosphate:Na+ symporter
MANKVKRYVYIAREYSFEKNDEYYEESKRLEERINILDKRIHDYIIKLIITDVSVKSSKLMSKYLDQIKDFERIGDHCKNLFGFFKERYENKMELSTDGIQDLEQIYDMLIIMTDLTIDSVLKWDSGLALEATKCEDQIDKLEEVFHARHVHRLNSGACSVLNSEHYVEVLANIERMGDHLENIAESVIVETAVNMNEEVEGII